MVYIYILYMKYDSDNNRRYMKSGDIGVSCDSGDTSICSLEVSGKSCYLWESMGFDTEFGWNLAVWQL